MSRTISIPKDIIKALWAEAERCAPLEACGLFAGKADVVTKFYPMTNADAAARHYTMVPEEQFAAVKDMRTNNIKMMIVWHSHPETPARLSPEDMRLAYMPGIAYMILSLSPNEEFPLRAFVVENDAPFEVKILTV